MVEKVKLTKHFTLEEMLRSKTADVKGYKEQYNPPQKVKDNLKALAVNILQPLRDEIGQVDVSSGYRCDRLNADKDVKGSKTSQHRYGEAADIKSKTKSIDEIIATIIRLKLPFDQLIHEFGRWVHVSYGPRNRRQVLKAVKRKDGTTAYLNYDPSTIAKNGGVIR